MTDSAELLSFFDSTELATPPGLNPIRNMSYNTDTKELRQDGDLVGTVIFNTPQHLTDAKVVNDELVLSIDDVDINLGSVISEYIYDLSAIAVDSVGVFNGTTYEPLTAVGFDITVDEQTDKVVVTTDPSVNDDRPKIAQIGLRQNRRGNVITPSVNSWTPVEITDKNNPMRMDVVVANNQFTLQPGIYYFDFTANHHYGLGVAAIRNVTDDQIAVLGMGHHSNRGTNWTSDLRGFGMYQIFKPTVFELVINPSTQGDTKAQYWYDPYTSWYQGGTSQWTNNICITRWNNDALLTKIPRPMDRTLVSIPMLTASENNQVVTESSSVDANRVGFRAIKTALITDKTIDAWISSNDIVPWNEQWIQIEFTDGPRTINSYEVANRYNTGVMNSPQGWELRGSNDGTNWTTIDVQSDHPFNSDSVRLVMDLDSDHTYSYFRFVPTEIYEVGSNTGKVSVKVDRFLLYYNTPL